MPSMRLNTTASAGIADPTEWQTVSNKAKAKTKTRSEEDAQQAVPSHDAVVENGAKRQGAAKPSVLVSRPSPSVTAQYQPDELGFEVLAAYDQAWAASTSPPTNKGGTGAKAAAAPVLLEPSFPVAPAPQVQPQEPKEPSKKAKKKAKSKQNAAVAAEEPAPTNNTAKSNQNGKANGTGASKAGVQPAGKKAAAASQTANGAERATSTSRSLPKVPSTVASASAQVDLSELSEHIAAGKDKHPKDGVLQLQLLASWLTTRAFPGVSYHLGVHIEKYGVNSAMSQPWGDAVEPVQKELLKCAEQCHPDDAARYVLRVCEQSIAALPEKGGAQSDVGELLVISAVCRARPLAIALASQGLCPLRSKILSPGRIPVTLWLLGQAASAGGDGAACSIHAWSRVVLPTITYQEVSLTGKPSKKASGKAAAKQTKPASVYHIEPAARDAALSFFKDVLLANKVSVHRSALKQAARSGVPVGVDGAGEPIVPPSAVAAAEAAASGTVATARGTADAVAAIKSDLADLCDSCRNPDVVAAAVSRALAAAESAAHAEDDEAVLAATQALVGQLTRHGDIAGQAWSKDHRNKLAGSTAVLELLAANNALVHPLLAVPLGNDTLLNVLDGIEKSQSTILSSAKDTNAKELAQRADRAARSLSYASINVLPASARWSLLSLAVVVAVTVVLSVRVPERVEAVLQPVVGPDRASLVTSTCQEAVSRIGQFVSAMWDAFTGDEDRDSVFSLGRV